jgi:L-fuconate dehydratase
MMVDANQVWDVDQAITWMKKLAQFKPWFIEEPTAPGDNLCSEHFRLVHVSIR